MNGTEHSEEDPDWPVDDGWSFSIVSRKRYPKIQAKVGELVGQFLVKFALLKMAYALCFWSLGFSAN